MGTVQLPPSRYSHTAPFYFIRLSLTESTLALEAELLLVSYNPEPLPHCVNVNHKEQVAKIAMFQPFSYALMFLALVAVNHKWGKPYEEAKTQKELRRARRRARYEKDRAQDKKDFADAQEKRREARKKRRQEEERLEELYQNRRHAYEVPGRRY